MTDSPQVSVQDWGRVEALKKRADSYLTEPRMYSTTVACCLVELRDRVATLEAAGGVAGNPGHDSAAPAGVTAEELVDCLPKRVVLQDWPPKVSTPLYWNSFGSLHGQAWQEGHTAGWAIARAEVERQQQGGQADG